MIAYFYKQNHPKAGEIELIVKRLGLAVIGGHKLKTNDPNTKQ